MTVVKFKSPFVNGQLEKSGNINYPFSGLLEDFFGNSYFQNELVQNVPAVNVSRHNDELHLELSAPGFSKEDIKVEVEKDVVTISGEHKAAEEIKEKTFYRKEFAFDSFKRSFNLPDEYNADNVSAKYENGILKLSFPQKKEIVSASRRITIE